MITKLVQGTLLVAVAGAPASAKVVERESFQDDFSFVDDDFCGAGIARLGVQLHAMWPLGLGDEM